MARKPTDMGRNRTGIAASPFDSKKTTEAGEMTVPLQTVDGGSLMDVRVQSSMDADPVGTMPPPATITGAMGSAVAAITGHKLTVFLDLLGERLAFERTGTRLYEALLAKHAASDHDPSGPTRAEIEQIHADELSHFRMLTEIMVSLGADPTSVTPSADIASVASMGALKVLTDPRTTLTEALRTMLSLELTDNEGWALLLDMATTLGQDELGQKFALGLAQEEEHLAKVRAWVNNAVHGQLGIDRHAPQVAAPHM